MMLAIFFNRTGWYNIAILPVCQEMNGTYSVEDLLVPLTQVCYPQGKKPHERRVTGYFKSALIHNTDVVQEHLANVGFTRMEHPPIVRPWHYAIAFYLVQ
jgi:hypothetical protein